MHLATLLTVARQAAVRLVAPVLVLYGVLVGLGLLVTRVLPDEWPLSVEDAVNRGLEAHRTGARNDLSLVFSTIASTPAIIAVTAVAAAVLWFVLRRWREPLFLIAAVSAQAAVFLFTTLAIDRQRPEVDRMDGSLPTSSFPSGHTSAAVALYCGLAVLLARTASRPSTRAAWWTLLLLVPIGVALTRMYRGMHHPSDVTASFLNGATCLYIMARGILDRAVHWGRRPTGTGHVPSQRTEPASSTSPATT
ncbi:phosphatase PAP2 family protein [Dactylosporangium aurantiacum]|uniref:Phosphatase PAP2 family protein n=1 Tax=Dactylosporangium aurantiacum TaxID=35754 RepID=A0A9Q9MHJ8_9ACTN|nr:phosphatase PAP2 family protein [Dactylosporangium aurantiacum]MDG6101441.1 phosphatase PAP2 family protein [Dactylosporangium aurantiacum]UWZ52706.1 phosphatase PAP2 family protein [Dactylosporangium aurantiacum]